ncbi:MAG: hypothetical protein GQ525_14730 [Draconibacterium sp.]|nr:hypothetical protein [Draconibacterium sp.]
MRTKFFTKLALIIVIVATVTTTTFGQRWNNANRIANNQATITQPTCINLITDLSDKQVTQIQDLEKIHQTEMDKFRSERRTTLDLSEKSIFRAEMDQKVLAHQNEVKALLTEEQQNQYNQLHTSNNPNFAQGRQMYGAGVGNNQAFVRGGGRGYNNVAYNRGSNRGMTNNQTFNARANRGNYYATAGKGVTRGTGNNQALVRGGGQGNYAMASNGRFNRGNSVRQGYGRNATYGRGYGRGFQAIPVESVEDVKE